MFERAKMNFTFAQVLCAFGEAPAKYHTNINV
jgi:hypothetical protein